MFLQKPPETLAEIEALIVGENWFGGDVKMNCHLFPADEEMDAYWSYTVELPPTPYHPRISGGGDSFGQAFILAWNSRWDHIRALPPNLMQEYYQEKQARNEMETK